MAGNVNRWWMTRIRSFVHSFVRFAWMAIQSVVDMKYLSWYHSGARDINEGVIELNADNLISSHLSLVRLHTNECARVWFQLVFSLPCRLLLFSRFFLVRESRVSCAYVCVCLCISIIVKWCVFIRDIKHLNQIIALMCMLLFVVLFWICLDERLGAHLALLYALSLARSISPIHGTTSNRALKLIINRWMRFARFVLSMCIDSKKERIMVLIFSFSNHPSLTSFLLFLLLCVCWIRSLIHYCVCIKEIYGVPYENHYLIQ